jgi:hypothetical protein
LRESEINIKRLKEKRSKRETSNQLFVSFSLLSS